jgi:hypothetical protein
MYDRPTGDNIDGTIPLAKPGSSFPSWRLDGDLSHSISKTTGASGRSLSRINFRVAWTTRSITHRYTFLLVEVEDLLFTENCAPLGQTWKPQPQSKRSSDFNDNPKPTLKCHDVLDISLGDQPTTLAIKDAWLFG